ncbi:type II secretion system protein GspD [Tenacibaculum sp. M341]|uniref:type II secretion system protein GspD n=1 Tax=Tenacibaculum sp. M341 TaxID=2530339 RepID=UPI001046A0E5|nr:type II secretion system protein GspD [Tenacibaculum sp. M341]TCI85587.1 type II secretion system protein GspD [Tenacibaculum sp. M341]
MLKKYIIISFLWFSCAVVFAQEINDKETQRIEKLKSELDALSNKVGGLTETVDFNVSDTELSTFVRAVGKSKKVNISVTNDIQSTTLTHNFSNAKVKDIILYLCKEHKFTFDITGNIIALKKYSPITIPKKPTPRSIYVDYDNLNDLFSVDLKGDSLAVAFKKITDVTSKNLVFAPGLEKKQISGYIKNKPFKSAMDKLAFSNNLLVTETKDGYFLFESDTPEYNQASTSTNNRGNRNGRNTGGVTRPRRYQSSNFFFKVIDSTKQIVEVDFENTPISSIIKDIGNQLNVNMFTNAPLKDIGKASVKAKRIAYEDLLARILEDSDFTFKKRNNIYYFGKNDQASLRSSVVIPLMHRSIEVMNQPLSSGGGRSSFSSGGIGGGFNSGFNNGGINGNNGNFNNNINNGGSIGNNRNSNFNNQQRINTRSNQTFGNYSSKSEALINILPSDVTKDLEIKTDIEHNTFIVSGDAQKIEKLKEFINKIDKPVPVVLIEVMILEVNNSSSISTGIDLGLGENPVNDSGSLFPSANVTLGASSINKIIGGFNGFGSLNVGKVVPNFFAKIQFLESNGDVKVRSTPKLSTLNGHQATLSNGERSYYRIERTDVIGAQNPQTIQTNNYVPIDADLTIGIRPIVSGDQQITLNINVMQSAFNDGDRVDPNAPPGMNIREFTSTIRVGDQDVVVLGGLEENRKNSVGSGVPLLARIPVLKWFFSKRTRTASKSKLSVLIKPTIIR